MEICGPSRKKSPRGECYFVLVIDDFSRLKWISFLRDKSNAFEKFMVFKALAENQTCWDIKCIRSERGGEFKPYDFKYFCDGIKRHHIIAYTPW